jgi:hypothetical protein
MDDLLALGPAVLLPALAIGWLGAAVTTGVTVGRAVRLADLHATRPASGKEPGRARTPLTPA